MIHHIDNNQKDLHMTSINSIEGEQMEEKLKCMASNSKEDLISELPETVLLHILSFLPTKESIRTSVVAKRWKNLWKSVPSLKFEICLSKGKLYKQNSEKFMDFVDKVFILRGDSSALSEFHLSYCDNGKGDTSFPCRLKLWIEYVARLKPRLLDLKLFSPLLSSIQLPTMKTLETLNMRGYSPIGTVHLQSPSGFHRLKVLKLRNVDFCFGEFAGFPILKELQLRDCRFVGDSMLNVSLPSLRILIMRNYLADNHEIKVSTPRLESFVLDGQNIFVFDRLYSLSELVIGGSTSNPICIDKLCKIVTGSCVKVFFWRHSYFMWNRLLEGLRACDAAPLANLKRLCLWLFRCNCDDYVASVIYLLENSPNLEKLVIPGFMEITHHGEHDKENYQPAKDPPNFTHRSLKKIEVAYNRKDCLQREWVKLLNSSSPRLKLKRFPVNSYYQLQHYHFRLPTL